MNKQPKIVLLDIETSPIKGLTWGMYDQNVLAVLEPAKIICAAWKYLDDPEIFCQSLPDYRGYRGGIVNDGGLVRELWKVLDEADVVVAHNGDSFDIKRLNARFVAHGLNAPSDYKTVDTLKVAKKYFRFDNNKLDELGHYLDVGRKAPNGGLATWLKCMAGDMAAWEEMRKYNVQDVALLERVYLRLRPFIQNHPNLNLIVPPVGVDGHSCSTCQSINVVRRGFAITKVGRYQRYQCKDCGSWSSGPYERVKAGV